MRESLNFDRNCSLALLQRHLAPGIQDNAHSTKAAEPPMSWNPGHASTFKKSAPCSRLQRYSNHKCIAGNTWQDPIASKEPKEGPQRPCHIFPSFHGIPSVAGTDPPASHLEYMPWLSVQAAGRKQSYIFQSVQINIELIHVAPQPNRNVFAGQCDRSFSICLDFWLYERLA